MTIPRVFVLLVVECVMGCLIVFSDGYTVQSGLKDYTYMHRAKRGMTPAVRGLLAWRKLLLNSKPARSWTSLKYNAYYKAGDFDNALKDFSSAVPNGVMTYSAKGKLLNNEFRKLLQKGRVYEGTVGDRIMILKERGAGFEDKLSTIDIVKGHTRDVVIYMGKEWQKDL